MFERFRFPVPNCIFLPLCGLIIIALPAHPHANELGVNVYGLSRHFPKYSSATDSLNEVNPGLGLRVSFVRASRSHGFVEAGFFEDSMENRAKYFSFGFMFRVVHQFRVGVNAAVYSTETINWGDPFLLPLPIASYSVGPVTANAVYMPKVQGLSYHILGFYATIRIFDGATLKK